MPNQNRTMQNISGIEQGKHRADVRGADVRGHWKQLAAALYSL